MGKTPDKMKILEINQNIENSCEKIGEHENQLKDKSLSKYAIFQLKKSIHWLKNWVFRLETEEQKRYNEEN